MNSEKEARGEGDPVDCGDAEVDPSDEKLAWDEKEKEADPVWVGVEERIVDALSECVAPTDNVSAPLLLASELALRAKETLAASVLVERAERDAEAGGLLDADIEADWRSLPLGAEDLLPTVATVKLPRDVSDGLSDALREGRREWDAEAETDTTGEWLAVSVVEA